MLLDRTHRQWAIISSGLLAAATVSYVIYASASHKGPTGGSWMGLAYGIIGSLMMIFSAMLAGRKQVPHWRIGSAQFWLRGHLWLGSLSLPFILFHSGFGLGGLLEQLLWLFFGLVIMSGVFGLLMQNFLPRLITHQIPRETFVAQLPFIRRRSRLVCDKLVSANCGKITLRNEELKPQLEALVAHSKEVTEKGAAAKGKEEKDRVKEIKENWSVRLFPEFRTLFLDLATFAKAQKWITREDDFTSLIATVYDFPNLEPKPQGQTSAEADTAATSPEKPKPASPLDALKAQKAAGADSAEKPKSPLELMKEKAAAKQAGESESKEPAPQKLSPLEQMKAQAAAKKSGLAPATEADKPVVKQVASEPTGDASQASPKKLSPLEQMKAQAAAKKAAAEGAAPEAPTADTAAAVVPEKKLSPLEQMKAQAAAKKAAAEGTAPATPTADAPAAAPEKKLSPLEQMKAQAAAKKAAAEGAAPTAPTADAPAAAPEKKLSPLEQMKAQAAAKKAAAEGAAPPAPTSDTAAVAPEKKLSPLEQMKAQAAKKEAGAGEAGAKPQSPLEAMKASKAAATPAASKPAPKSSEPAPAIIKRAVVATQLLRTEELGRFYAESLRPFLNSSGRQGPLADEIASNREFAQMREALPVELHDILQTLQASCDEHRQYARLERMHHWLHYWLALHIPFSIALFVFFIAHVIFALRVVPWSPFTR